MKVNMGKVLLVIVAIVVLLVSYLGIMGITSYFYAPTALEKMEKEVLANDIQKYFSSDTVIVCDGNTYLYVDIKDKAERIMQYVSLQYDVVAIQIDNVYEAIESEYGIFNVELPIFSRVETFRKSVKPSDTISMKMHFRRTLLFGWKIKQIEIEHYNPDLWKTALQ